MKVKCIANTGEELSQKTLNAGYEKTFTFNIKIDTEYAVYSMLMWGDTLDYLISTNTEESPSWFSAELFEVVNHLLPLVWFFTFDKYKNYKSEDSQIAIWGYREMVSDPEHHIALTEEKEEALRIFFKRKRQIDEFEESS